MPVQPLQTKEDIEDIEDIQRSSIDLLKQLIRIPSFSKQEDKTASAIGSFLQSKEIPFERYLNNIWAINKYFDDSKPTILLNSHHDTVQPNSGYTIDPFVPEEIDGKLYGLGSNDAGGCLVALIGAFTYFYSRSGLKYNLVLAASAEEEISGSNGIEALLQEKDFKRYLTNNVCAIVGEPTQMQMAVAEKGLMVLDCISHGIAGHAARNEGDNAIYKAVHDINWFLTYRFPKVSDFLGPVKMTVTSIETANKAHNVVPGECRFVVDLRINELYTFDDVIKTIRENIGSDVAPRSIRLRSSSIATDHPLVKAGTVLGKTCYGSPTTSDKALMPFPSLKMGPGVSARSHSADEFIYVDEIREGIRIYIDLLKQLL